MVFTKAEKRRLEELQLDQRNVLRKIAIRETKSLIDNEKLARVAGCMDNFLRQQHYISENLRKSQAAVIRELQAELATLKRESVNMSEMLVELQADFNEGLVFQTDLRNMLAREQRENRELREELDRLRYETARTVSDVGSDTTISTPPDFEPWYDFPPVRTSP